MQDFIDSLPAFLSPGVVLPWVRASIVLLVGMVAARLVRRTIQKTAGKHLSAQGLMVGRRLAGLGVWTLTIIAALNELGFDLKVLLGAAGVLTVAVGFASQTVASNLISGVFLLIERPFVVGDTIQIDTALGEVISVDLLSVKLRTFDNLLLRVPSESMFNQRIINLSHFPIRRYDLRLTVAFTEDLDRVRKLLVQAAERRAICLDEPVPAFIFQGYGAVGLDLQFSVWAARENYLELRNTFPAEVQRVFADAGVVIPAPRQALETAQPLQVVVRSEPTVERSEPGPDRAERPEQPDRPT